MESTQIKLLDVRLSFPDIWEAKALQKDAEAKFGAHFLLDKTQHAEQIKAVKKAISAIASEKFGETAIEMIKKGKVHICIHEGSEKEYDGYNEDNMYISASSSKRPLILDRDKSALVKQDGRPYAGCYVNAVIRLWPQDNQYGKRINAELLGVQYVREGEAFGAAPLSDDAFEDLDEGKGGNKGKETGRSGRRAEPEPPETDDLDEDEIPF